MNLKKNRTAVLVAAIFLSPFSATSQAQTPPPAAASPATASEVTLPEIQVRANADSRTDLSPAYPGGQIARGGGLGILGDTKVMDAPFNTTNFTSELVEDQQARTLADVVTNDASVRITTARGGFGDDFMIRGFSVPSGDVGLNGLFGLTSASRLPAEIVERITVLKGPGSLINGIAPNGSIGGGINVTTKRAGDTPLTRLTTSYSSESQFGTHLDVGQRFGERNEWGIRFNGVWRDGEASIDKGNQRVGVASLGLDYRGDRLRWSLDAFTQREKIDEVRPQIGFLAGVKSLPSPPSSRLNFFPGTDLKLRDTTVATRVEYDFTDYLTAYAGAGYRDGSADQMFPSGPSDALGNFTVRNGYYDSYSRTVSTEAGVRIRFDTAGIRHTLAVGASRLDQEAGNFYVASTTTNPSNIYHPAPLPIVTGDRKSPQKASDTTLSSIAVTDTLSFANDRLLLTLGVRDQRVQLDNFSTATGKRTSSYDESATSPLVGIVFKPINNVSLYGNYTEGLTRGAIAPATATNAGEAFPPFKSKQYEAGVKVDWGSVITTASAFQITRPNSFTDPVTNVFSFDGEQRNRGLELSAYGEVVRGLRIMAGIVFNDAELSKTAGGLNEGNDAPGVPDRTISLGVDWDVPGLPGVSLNGRALYTSPVYFNAANNIRLDSWTRYDIGARYRTAIAGKEVVLRANVENLFDKKYWLLSGSYATVNAPRTVMLSASIDF